MIRARVLIRDKILIEYAHVYQWQIVEVLNTRVSRSKKNPRTSHLCKNLKTGQTVTLFSNEIEILN